VKMSFIEKAMQQSQDAEENNHNDRLQKNAKPHAVQNSKRYGNNQATYRKKESLYSNHDGIVDLKKLQSVWPVSECNTDKVKDEYRKIKRPLLINVGNDQNIDSSAPQNLILVTSALEGEGKTFNSINLALSLAKEKNIHVYLIDSDVHKKKLSKLSMLEGKKGVTDYLAGETNTIGDVIFNTSQESLSIIPAGTINTEVPELYSSQAMRGFLDKFILSKEDVIVIFDGPPLLQCAETQILAQNVGQVAIVISAGLTTSSQVEDAISLVDNDRSIGLILNKSSIGASSTYYGAYG